MREEKGLPLVSVAIITFNQKKFLKECIESILDQNYINTELVIADDCSTDGTQEMLKEYSKKYPNKFILKLSTENQGITKNSNLAHFACSGKYIAWMGGDDLMLPGKLKKQVEYMEKNLECSICYHNLDVFESKTNKTLYYYNEYKKYEGNIETIIKKGIFNGACSNMVRRSKAPREGFNLMIPIASDGLYWINTLYNGGTINYIDDVLGRYRRHSENITVKTNDIGLDSLDHLNTINILFREYPEFVEEISCRASILFKGLRFKMNYKRALLISNGYKINLKSCAGLICYLISFGKIKL